MVGDRWLDVACGMAPGTRALLVRTGHGAHEAERRPAGARPDAILNNLMEAVGWILRNSLALIGALTGRTVAVIGDVVADEFVYGRVARVSREAPVLILEYDSTEIVPGGAGNAAQQRRGARRHARRWWRLSAATNRARRLLAALHRRVDRAPACRARPADTPIKTRILAGGIHSAKQQVVRIDRGVGTADRRSRARALRTRGAARRSGVPTRSWCPTTGRASSRRRSARTHRAALCARAGPPIPVLIDSRYRLLDYRGLTACTPNESEVEQALGVRIDDDPRCSSAPDARSSSARGCRPCSSRAAAAAWRSSCPSAAPCTSRFFGSDEIADVTGAGDTVMATMALALAAGATFEAAARLANYAGGTRRDEARHGHRVEAGAASCGPCHPRRCAVRAEPRRGRA